MNSYMMRCAIWYLLYNLKKVKNTHGEVFLSVKLQALSMGVFHVFQITQMVPNRAKNHMYISMTKFCFSYFSKANRGKLFLITFTARRFGIEALLFQIVVAKTSLLFVSFKVSSLHKNEVFH